MDERLTGDTFTAIKSVIRSATPSLIILFGITANLVYAKRFEASPGDATSKPFQRAVICYLCYTALGIFALCAGEIGLARLAKGMLLLDTLPFANIFKIYALLLPSTAALLLVQARAGMKGLWLLVRP